MKKNAYLARQEEHKNNFMHSVEDIIRQYMVDTLQITLYLTEGWGYERQDRLMENWKKTREEFIVALNPRDPECDVAQEHINRILEQIINGNQDLIPWEERYPALRGVKYKGR